MKTGRSLSELALELERQRDAKRDFIADTALMSMENTSDGLSLQINNGSRHEAFGINDIAHRQIGSFLKIPAVYYERMRNEAPDLLTDNVNNWLLSQEQNTRRMIRTLDGTARAFLSDRYRRIDNFEIATTVLPIIGEMEGATIKSCELTDSRMYIKVVNPRVQAEVSKGDIVQAGVLITNSETGQGSVNVSPLIYRLVCTNGMIAEDNRMRKYHVGRTNEGGDDFSIFRNETIEADARAFLMKMEDTVKAAVDQARFSAIVDRLRESTEAKIEPQIVPQVVELAASEFRLTQDEGKGILGHLIEGGDLSLYGLANAVTRHSQDVKSYDRASELEATGWKMVTMAPALWRKLTEVKE